MTAALAVALAFAGGAAPVAAQESDVLATSPGFALTAGAATAVLKTPSGPLAARIASVRPGRQLYLVLKDARAVAPPSTVYRVYLGPAQGEPIGSVNFFNAEQNRPRDYSFDVTERLRTLQAAGTVVDSVTVTIAPTAPPNPSAKPTVGSVALVAQ